MCTQTPKISVKFLLGQELAQGGGKNQVQTGSPNPVSHTLVEPAP